jgi:hypothetical protein
MSNWPSKMQIELSSSLSSTFLLTLLNLSLSFLIIFEVFIEEIKIKRDRELGEKNVDENQ